MADKAACPNYNSSCYAGPVHIQEDILADCRIPPDLKIYESKTILHLFPVRIGFNKTSQYKHPKVTQIVTFQIHMTNLGENNMSSQD